MPSGTLYKWVLCGLLITLKLSDAFSAPVGDCNDAICTPCAGPMTVTEANKKTSEETILKLHILLKETKSLVGTFKFEIVKSIDNSNTVTLLDNFKFLQTINADEIKGDLGTKTDLGKIFKSNFEKFSELAIYIYFAASDANASHVSNVKAILNKLWTILCELQIGTLSQGESITQYLNTSVISDQVSLATSPEEILFRNYIIIRDVHKNLEQFILLYKDISVTI